MRMRTALAVLALVVGGCGDDDGPSDALAKPTVLVRSTSLGEVLTDDQGRTLYLFSPDTAGTSRCDQRCTELWPPLLHAEPSVGGEGVSQSKVGTIKRSTGEPQVTYNGKPLYRYRDDAAPGDVKGHGVNDVWFAVTPEGHAVRSTTTTAGGSDY